jgi:hypothetical protein
MFAMLPMKLKNYMPWQEIEPHLPTTTYSPATPKTLQLCDNVWKGAHGGGAFSEKIRKVDRSAAYATRHIAKT